MYDWLSKNKINLVYNLDNRKYPNISLAGKHMGLIVTDIFGQDIPEPSRVFNIKFMYWQVMLPAFSSKGPDSVNAQNNINTNQQINNNTNMSDKPTVSATNIQPNDCKTMEEINPGFAETNKFFTNKVCLDFGVNNISLAGKYGSIHGCSFFTIYLNRCVNSTENMNSCMPQAYIDKILALAGLSIFTTEYDLNPEEYESPFQEYHNMDHLQISSSIFKKFEKKYNKIILNYDKGLFTPDIQTVEAYRTESIVESVDLRASNTIMPGLFNQVMLLGSGKNEIFNISFMKLPQALANIGGILQVILFTGKFLLYFWSKNSMLDFVISKIFTEEEREKSLELFKENINKNFSFKTIYNRTNNPNLNINNDNIDQPHKQNYLNHNLNADAYRDVSKNHLVKRDNYLDFIPQELKYQKRFIDENKDHLNEFCYNNINASDMNLKNNPDNHVIEINEIKSGLSQNIHNNKEIINARPIRDKNERENEKTKILI